MSGVIVTCPRCGRRREFETEREAHTWLDAHFCPRDQLRHRLPARGTQIEKGRARKAHLLSEFLEDVPI